MGHLNPQDSIAMLNYQRFPKVTFQCSRKMTPDLDSVYASCCFTWQLGLGRLLISYPKKSIPRDSRKADFPWGKCSHQNIFSKSKKSSTFLGNPVGNCEILMFKIPLGCNLEPASAACRAQPGFFWGASWNIEDFVMGCAVCDDQLGIVRARNPLTFPVWMETWLKTLLWSNHNIKFGENCWVHGYSLVLSQPCGSFEGRPVCLGEATSTLC